MINSVVIGMIACSRRSWWSTAFVAVDRPPAQRAPPALAGGSTPAEVKRSVVTEAAIVAVVGVIFGGLASLATIVPFAIARDEGVVPDGQLWLPPLLVVGVVVLTLTAARGAVRPALQKALHTGATGR